MLCGHILNAQKGSSFGHWLLDDWWKTLQQHHVALTGFRKSNRLEIILFSNWSEMQSYGPQKLQRMELLLLEMDMLLNYGSNNSAAYGVKVEIDGRIDHAILYTNGNIQKEENAPQITLGSNAVIDGGVYAAGYADWTVNGAKITGSTAFEIRAGSLTVNSGTFKGTGTPIFTKPNGNGSTTDGVGYCYQMRRGFLIDNNRHHKGRGYRRRNTILIGGTNNTLDVYGTIQRATKIPLSRPTAQY